jgi:hypothetical protein
MDGEFIGAGLNPKSPPQYSFSFQSGLIANKCICADWAVDT